MKNYQTGKLRKTEKLQNKVKRKEKENGKKDVEKDKGKTGARVKTENEKETVKHYDDGFTKALFEAFGW